MSDRDYLRYDFPGEGSRHRFWATYPGDHQALGELSIDCELWESGEAHYDAQNVLGLFSGPAEEATEEIVEMMDNTLAERVPGAGRRKGTYPGRVSDTISFTVIISNIGEGTAMDKIETFFTDATRMLGEVQHKREGREKHCGSGSRACGCSMNR